MTSGNATALLAMLFVVLVPLAILATSEFEERLRQADSPFRAPVLIFRTWLLPVLFVTRLVAIRARCEWAPAERAPLRRRPFCRG